MKYHLINSTSFWISCISYTLENRKPKRTTTATELIIHNSRWNNHLRLTKVTVTSLQIKNELVRKFLTIEDDI